MNAGTAMPAGPASEHCREYDCRDAPRCWHPCTVCYPTPAGPAPYPYTRAAAQQLADKHLSLAIRWRRPVGGRLVHALVGIGYAVLAATHRQYTAP